MDCSILCVYTIFFLNFRQECSKLREELKIQHDEDKKAAMAQLLQMKEREINTAKDGWQKKVEDLLDQVPRICVVLWVRYIHKNKMMHCVRNDFIYILNTCSYFIDISLSI